MSDKNTEQKILKAAKQVFHQKGMAGARMQVVADTAGINKALLHYYFRSKQQLFEGVFIEALTTNFPSIWKVLGTELPLFEKITAFVGTYIEVISKDPFIPSFIVSELQRDPERLLQLMRDKLPKGLEVFTRQVEEAVGAGLIQPTDPKHLFVDMLGLCVYPFIAKPIIMSVGKMDQTAYDAFIQERKQHIPELLVNGIKK